MALRPDNFEHFELGLGNPNEVAIAGEAYLDAARIYRIRLMRKIKKMFFFVPDWYVVHHLSFISVELYLKSFGANIYYTPDGDESGPFDQFTDHGYYGHGFNDKGIPSSILPELKRTLPSDQYSLLESLREKGFPSTELAIGRYPYERNERRREYPSGEDGRQRAEKWLKLAKSLQKFRMRPSSG